MGKQTPPGQDPAADLFDQFFGIRELAVTGPDPEILSVHGHAGAFPPFHDGKAGVVHLIAHKGVGVIVPVTGPFDRRQIRRAQIMVQHIADRRFGDGFPACLFGPGTDRSNRFGRHEKAGPGA